jgi:hypothetical protein
MKTEMTPRERLLTVLKGDRPDRVPVAPFVQKEYLSVAYPDKPRLDRVADATALAEELDFDLMAKHKKFETPHFLRKSYPNWELKSQTVRKNGVRLQRFQIETPLRTMRYEESAPDVEGAGAAGIHPSVSKYLLEEEEDIEAFLEFLPELDEASMNEMQETAQLWRRIIGDRGVLAPWSWAPVDRFAYEHEFAVLRAEPGQPPPPPIPGPGLGNP